MARQYTSAPTGAGAGVAGTADGRPPRELPVTAEQAGAPLLAARKIEIWNDVTSMNWSEFRPLAALACLPAIVLLIACGLALGHMTAALAATRGNQIRAADLLGVNRNTLRKKIRDLDIQVFRNSS